MRKLILATITLCLGAVTSASAETEVSLYFGYQTAPHSRLTGDVAGTPVDKLIGWEGRSFEAPPYYGGRVVHWTGEKFGFGVEFTHAKTYAPDTEMAPEFSALEFTDGHNIFTINAHRRWEDAWANGRVTPYVLGGIGVAVPHVDIQPTYAGAPHTFGYQLTGPAVRLGAGASWDINDRWALFGEYQFTWSDNEIELDGGGTLNTQILTNALNFGVTMKF